MKVTILPAPERLKEDVECFRIVEYSGEAGLAINVCINGMPGIVFQHNKGHSPIKEIVTRSGVNSFNGQAPTLFVYGQNTVRGVMNHEEGPFTMTQVILKPHALRTLLGLNAAELTNNLVSMGEFTALDLNSRLMEASSEHKRINLLTDFFMAQQKRVKARDVIVEESLHLIQENIRSVGVRALLQQLAISESQFERRFRQMVGVSPHFYIRVKRFNEAVRFMRSKQLQRLTDVAHALNFYDQSHFIRDVKEFSGITPKSLSQKEDNFFHDQGGYFYV